MARANAGDPTAIVELCLSRAVEAEPIGFAKLAMGKPSRKLFKALPRTLAQVDRGLLDLFVRLAAGEAPWPLLLWGGVGCGKTMAGLCFLDFGYGSYWSLETLCDGVMRQERPWLDDPSLIVIDEIGERRKAGELQCTTLKAVLDHREMNSQRVGVYISNLSPSDLAGLYDDRIASRLTAGSVFHLGGQDRRHEDPPADDLAARNPPPNTYLR